MLLWLMNMGFAGGDGVAEAQRELLKQWLTSADGYIPIKRQ